MTKPIAKTVSGVVDKGWCTGCGTCAAFCPADALRMSIAQDGNYVPHVKAEACTGCGFCLELCPAANENFKELNEFVFGKAPDDVLLGNVSNCYTGYSADSELRYRATSGGTITSLLLFLLREKMIDGAVLTRLKKDEPLVAEPFIARSEEEILSAMGSKYVPVPLNTILKTVFEGEGKFAIVALPCHLHGIRRAEMKIEGLRQKIIYHFGLVCSRTMSSHGWTFVLDKIGIAAEDISELKFRGEGWPGGLIAYLKNGERRFLPMLGTCWSEIFGASYFSNYYCTLCSDIFADMSDISFADAYIKSIMKTDKNGTSILLTRTCQGQQLVEKAVSQNIIEVSDLSLQEALKAQLFMTMYKKRNIRARINIQKMLGIALPPNLEDNIDTFLKPTICDYLVAPIPYANIYFSKHKFFEKLLKRIPLGILRFYRKAFKWLLVRKTKSMVRPSDE